MSLLYSYAVCQEAAEETGLTREDFEGLFMAHGWDGITATSDFLRALRKKAMEEYCSGHNFSAWWARHGRNKDCRETARAAFAAGEAVAFAIYLEPDWD